MCSMTTTLTISFDGQFWIGLFERQDGNHYSVCKVTFGSEPKDYEVLDFILRNWHKLKFSCSDEYAEVKTNRKINPKRLQRKIKQNLSLTGIGTKAQQALKLQHENNKTKHKANSRAKREAEKERMFQMKQKKRKEKHRGH